MSDIQELKQFNQGSKKITTITGLNNLKIFQRPINKISPPINFFQEDKRYFLDDSRKFFLIKGNERKLILHIEDVIAFYFDRFNETKLYSCQRNLSFIVRNVFRRYHHSSSRIALICTGFFQKSKTINFDLQNKIILSMRTGKKLVF
jgi:hypothetical protein